MDYFRNNYKIELLRNVNVHIVYDVTPFFTRVRCRQVINLLTIQAKFHKLKARCSMKE